MINYKEFKHLILILDLSLNLKYMNSDIQVNKVKKIMYLILTHSKKYIKVFYEIIIKLEFFRKDIVAVSFFQNCATTICTRNCPEMHVFFGHVEVMSLMADRDRSGGIVIVVEVL